MKTLWQNKTHRNIRRVSGTPYSTSYSIIDSVFTSGNKRVWQFNRYVGTYHGLQLGMRTTKSSLYNHKLFDHEDIVSYTVHSSINFTLRLYRYLYTECDTLQEKKERVPQNFFICSCIQVRILRDGLKKRDLTPNSKV